MWRKRSNSKGDHMAGRKKPFKVWVVNCITLCFAFACCLFLASLLPFGEPPSGEGRLRSSVDEASAAAMAHDQKARVSRQKAEIRATKQAQVEHKEMERAIKERKFLENQRVEREAELERRRQSLPPCDGSFTGQALPRLPKGKFDGGKFNSQYRMYFNTIQKNGYSTIRDLLIRLSQPLQEGVLVDVKGMNMRCDSRQDPCHTAYSPQQFDQIRDDPQWKKIIVLRDPIDRFVSAYLMWCVRIRAQPKHCINFIDSIESPNFDAFVETASRLGFANNRHYMPQRWFVKNLDLYTDVIFLEKSTFTETLRDLLLSSGVPQKVVSWAFTKERTVVNSNGDLQITMSPSSRALLLDMYADDYKLLEEAKDYMLWRQKCRGD